MDFYLIFHQIKIDSSIKNWFKSDFSSRFFLFRPKLYIYSCSSIDQFIWIPTQVPQCGGNFVIYARLRHPKRQFIQISSLRWLIFGFYWDDRTQMKVEIRQDVTWSCCSPMNAEQRTRWHPPWSYGRIRSESMDSSSNGIGFGIWLKGNRQKCRRILPYSDRIYKSDRMTWEITFNVE
jgi:hypothetical protein